MAKVQNGKMILVDLQTIYYSFQDVHVTMVKLALISLCLSYCMFCSFFCHCAE